MTRYGAVLDFCGALSDGDGICNLTARVFKDASVLRAAYAALGPQMPQQLFLQHSARLNEQATVNGLVGHAQALVLGILGFQPSGNLLRRPVQIQFTRNDLLQLHMDRKKTAFGPQGRLPGFAVGLVGSIHTTATMTCDFPAHGRHCSVQAFGNRPYRRTRNDPSRDLLALTQREREERAPPDRRNKPTVTRHQTTNGRMLLAEGAPDLMQRLPRLPTTPQVAFLRRRKPKPFPLGHKHHLLKQLYTRWCCIDRLSPQRQSDTSWFAGCVVR